MKPWTKEQIEEAATFSWILYNKDDKPMVDAICNRCDIRFQHELTEDNTILPMYCKQCDNGMHLGLDLANGDDCTVRYGEVVPKVVEFNWHNSIPSDYKWHQKLRLRLSFVLDDIKYYLWDRWAR